MTVVTTRTVGKITVWNPPADITKRIAVEERYIKDHKLRRHPQITLRSKKPSTFARSGDNEFSLYVRDIVDYEKG